MNDEPIIPREQELHEIREFFCGDHWMQLKWQIELEIEQNKEFILDAGDLWTEITVSTNNLLTRLNEFVHIYKEKFKIEHIQNALQRFIIDDNERKILFKIWGDKKEFSERDVQRAKCKILRHFLSFEELYREKDWQDEEENNNTHESWLDPLWEWIWISL